MYTEKPCGGHGQLKSQHHKLTSAHTHTHTLLGLLTLQGVTCLSEAVSHRTGIRTVTPEH